MIRARRGNILAERIAREVYSKKVVQIVRQEI